MSCSAERQSVQASPQQGFPWQHENRASPSSMGFKPQIHSQSVATPPQSTPKVSKDTLADQLQHARLESLAHKHILLHWSVCNACRFQKRHIWQHGNFCVIICVLKLALSGGNPEHVHVALHVAAKQAFNPSSCIGCFYSSQILSRKFRISAYFWL